MFLDELVSIFVAAGVGTLGTTIFMTTKATLPPTGGPYLSVVATGGSGPEGTHNAAFTNYPAYVRPTAQIVARAPSAPAAQAMAQAAFNALTPIRNRKVLGVWWRQIKFLQSEPFDFGLDDVGRSQFVFNVEVTKRPNAAMSV